MVAKRASDDECVSSDVDSPVSTADHKRVRLTSIDVEMETAKYEELNAKLEAMGARVLSMEQHVGALTDEVKQLGASMGDLVAGFLRCRSAMR